jgi:YegS/Rv2252/BmrU family lipid kinase
MNHIFILNPVSGNGTVVKNILPQIAQASKELNIPYQFYISKSIGDCEEYVRNYDTFMEPTRFYACGGDGTLNEVVNGAYGKENVQIGIVPAGTGNDFVKTFKNYDNFSNLKNQFTGIATSIDLISYNNRIGVNVCNIGFDSAVADRIVHLKTNPLISGKMAYGVGIFQEFFRKMGNNLKVTLDNGEIVTGEMLLAAIGVGSYYGGGFCALPYATRYEGTFDICLVRKMGRLKFLKVIDTYKHGKHVEDEGLKDYVIYRKAKEIKIECVSDLKLCSDGEVTLAKEINFKIIPKGILLSIPTGVEI